MSVLSPACVHRLKLVWHAREGQNQLVLTTDPGGTVSELSPKCVHRPKLDMCVMHDEEGKIS